MDKFKIVFWRDFLFRTFLIGVVFAIIFFILGTALREVWMVYAKRFFHLEEPEIDELVLSFFLNIRLVLVFLILAPALALHWMQRGKAA